MKVGRDNLDEDIDRIAAHAKTFGKELSSYGGRKYALDR